MDKAIKNKLSGIWTKYFEGSELPITFYYSDTGRDAELLKPGSVPRCIIAALGEIRKGRSLAFNVDSVGCAGGKRYLGFATEIRPEFEYFLSCGIPGKVVGGRYSESPELVKRAVEYMPPFPAPSPFIIFKRWDQLTEKDDPDVAVFFATPDTLSGLFTLANYDEAEPNGVLAPFGSGCSTVVHYPFLEKDSSRPRAVIGLFDVSARPFVADNTLTFSVPMIKLRLLIDNADESFLTTNSWAAVRKRIAGEKR